MHKAYALRRFAFTIFVRSFSLKSIDRAEYKEYSYDREFFPSKELPSGSFSKGIELDATNRKFR